MTNLVHTLAAALCLALVLSGRPVQASEPNDPYTEAVRIGVQEFDRGNYAESLAAMRRAHVIDPNARTLRGMGLAAFEMGDYVAALDYLHRSLTDTRKPLTDELRTQVQAVIRRAETNVATVVLRVTPNASKVRIDDGVPEPLPEGGALRLNLGTHTLELRADGHEPQRLRLELVGGDRPELEVELQPKSRPTPMGAPAPAAARDPKRPWGQVLIALSGTALAGGAVAAGIRQRTAANYNDESQCGTMPSVQCPEEADRELKSRWARNALFIAGGALAIPGIALLWVSKRKTRSDGSAASLDLRCNAGLGVDCRLRF